MRLKIKSILTAGLLTATTVAGLALTGTASASAASASAASASAATASVAKPVTGVVKVLTAGQKATNLAPRAASYSYTLTRYDSEVWNASVRIYSGDLGAVTYCSDGSVHYGPTIGPGYWAFGGNCYGYGTLTGYGFWSQ